MKNKYQQLTYVQRCQISALKNTGCTQEDIAIALGMSPATISRALARNTGLRAYRHKQTHDRIVMRRKNVIRTIKMIAKMTASIGAMLRQEWRPEQLSGVLAGGYGDLCQP